MKHNKDIIAKNNKTVFASEAKQSAAVGVPSVLARDLTLAVIVFSILLLVTVLIGGCAQTTATTNGDKKVDITAVKTSSLVTINGVVDEAAWNEAETTTIKLTAEAGVEPREITVRALYDEKNIYIAASYKDETPLKIGEAWEYDGAKWTKGSYDDTLAFVFDIDGSVKGFTDKGMDVMTRPLKRGMDVFDFTLEVDENQPAAGRLDFWGWCGMPEFYGKGDDMIFMLDKTTNYDNTTKMLTIQHDKHDNQTPWIRNQINLNGQDVPKYMLKPGLDTTTTPRPYQEDVTEVTDYTVFKAGDRAPFVIGIKGATWGGSKDDITPKGKNVNGAWLVEFSRALDTGHDDDVKLTPGKNATFVIVVRDDGKGYAVSRPVTLKLGGE